MIKDFRRIIHESMDEIEKMYAHEKEKKNDCYNDALIVMSNLFSFIEDEEALETADQMIMDFEEVWGNN